MVQKREWPVAERFRQTLLARAGKNDEGETPLKLTELLASIPLAEQLENLQRRGARVEVLS